MSQKREIGLEEIRSLGLEALKNFLNNKPFWGGGLQTMTLLIEIACVGASKGMIPLTPGGEVKDSRLNDNETMMALEIISNFMTEGILMWGYNKDNPSPLSCQLHHTERRF